jgi:xylulose-5-phosphate/fructose-6-phosphate phosphoketolase
MEMLSEHTLEGWLEGYLLTGRHGFFSTYEAFVHVIDSMFNQHAKWLEIITGLPIRILAFWMWWPIRART